MILNICDLGGQLFLFNKMNMLDQKIKPAEYMVGSYFCEHYFLKETESIISKLADTGVKIRCVMPIVSQTNLEAVWSMFEEIQASYRDVISSWVVNDIGALQRIQGHTDKVILGRLFHKPIRDPRYPETMTGKKYLPDIDTERLIEKYDIFGTEIENLYTGIEPSSPPCNIYVHQNYNYMSCMRICLYSSIAKETDQKFRTDTACDLSCKRNIHRTKLQNDEGVYIIGKGIYYKAPDKDSFKDARIADYIYTPIDELLGDKP